MTDETIGTTPPSAAAEQAPADPPPTAPAGRLSSLRADIAESPAFLPGLAAMAVLVWFAADEGGFRATTWLPGTLVVVALLAMTALIAGRPRPSRAAAVAVALLAGYAAWSFLSIAWAQQKGVAWDGANRTLLYATIFALFALWPLRARAAGILLGGYSLAVVAIGVVELLRIGADPTPGGFFFEARLAEPVGYVNGDVALWFAAFWPCLILATRREVHPLLRGAFLGGAGVLWGLALMGQSRGWLFAVPVMVVVAIALVPGRARTLASMGVLGIAAYAMNAAALAVYDDYEPGRSLAGAADHAVETILAIACLLAVAGAIVGYLERGVRVSAAAERRTGAIAVGLLVALAIGGVGFYAVDHGSPAAKAADYWDDFKEGGSTPEAGDARLTTTAATDRYYFWEVGWEMFAERPFTGFGADNFQREFFVRGKGSQQPRYPHSLEIRVLAQTGGVGALLLLGALIAAGVAFAPLTRGRPDLARAVGGSAVLLFLYWVAHGSLDWLWEFPALGGGAWAALGIALAVVPRPEGQAGERSLSPPAVVAVAVVALAAGLSLAAPWLSVRDVHKAGETWQSDPAAAFDQLDRAAKLNPLSPLPDLTAGTIATRVEDFGRAERYFRDALDRERDEPYALLELGALASMRGDRQAAIRLLERANAQNPRYDLPRQALRRVRRGERLDVGVLNRSIVESDRSRIGG
ncbi:MAG TPA: O-antigen ligase family protein [Thermoleophilaceae bacterium]|nr:O-antigen ligase family protein [Thermoleophilaceae bacterium]